MTKLLCLSLAYIILYSWHTLYARFEHNFVFTIAPYYANTQPQTLPENFSMLNGFSHPLSTHTLWNTSGIAAVYAGYINLSDIHGQITFPHATQKPTFLLVITTTIQPVFMLGNTIHHWQLPVDGQSACYSIQRKQDETTKLYFWDVQKTNNPNDNILPLDALLLFYPPQDVIVPCGISITSEQPNMILPTIYAKNPAQQANIVCALPNIKAFFGSLQSTIKKQSDSSVGRIIEP